MVTWTSDPGYSKGRAKCKGPEAGEEARRPARGGEWGRGRIAPSPREGRTGAAFTRRRWEPRRGLCSGALGGTGVLGCCTDSRLQGARRPQESRKEALQEPPGWGQDPVGGRLAPVPFEGGAAWWIVLGDVRGKGAGCGRVSRGRWREPAGAGGEEILPRAESPRWGLCKTSGTWPAAVFHLVPTQLFVCFFFFFLMYCQYFKTGRLKKKNKKTDF